ncbi:hypothetical protein EDD11_000954 [Mortierella claussenii]|nr:hypothetical protein EDD11_000954 [Mortierella claussenii]
MSIEAPSDGFMTPPPGTHREPDVEELISLLISLGCITLMSVLFGRKTAGTKIGAINYARGLVISLYLISWTFSFIATQLAQTNDLNEVSCTLSIYTCIILYALSKVVIYLFLMEKVYVVTAVGMTRKEFMLYKINMGLMSPYFGIVALMIVFRVAEVDVDGQCHIGLLKPAALPLILYDMFLSIWLTLLFIRPLMSSKSLLQGPSKGRLRDVARRTLIGAILALILSSANVFTLVYFQGNERGLICLASCTCDVTLNAITIHWVTSRATSKDRGAGGSGGKGGIATRPMVQLNGGKDIEGRSHVSSGVVSDMDGIEVPHYSVAIAEHTYSMGVYGSSGGGGGGQKQFGKKVFDPTDTHITVEAYVDEYHQPSSVGSGSELLPIQPSQEHVQSKSTIIYSWSQGGTQAKTKREGNNG